MGDDTYIHSICPQYGQADVDRITAALTEQLAESRAERDAALDELARLRAALERARVTMAVQSALISAAEDLVGCAQQMERYVERYYDVAECQSPRMSSFFGILSLSPEELAERTAAQDEEVWQKTQEMYHRLCQDCGGSGERTSEANRCPRCLSIRGQAREQHRKEASDGR